MSSITATETSVAVGRGPGFWSQTAALLRKDLVIEARARATLPPMVAFAFTVTLLLAFALPPGTGVAEPVRLPLGAVGRADVLAGFLWVTTLFAGLIGFARSFEVERSDGALDSLLLVPLDRSGLFAAKAITNLVFLMAVQAFLIPTFALLFSANLGGRWIVLSVMVLAADIGFVVVGTLFAALATQTRSRELMLPVLALPALVPAFIAAVALTSDVFAGAPVGDVTSRGWFGVLIAYDIVFTVVGALAFEFVLEPA